MVALGGYGCANLSTCFPALGLFFHPLRYKGHAEVRKMLSAEMEHWSLIIDW